MRTAIRAVALAAVLTCVMAVTAPAVIALPAVPDAASETTYDIETVQDVTLGAAPGTVPQAPEAAPEAAPGGAAEPDERSRAGSRSKSQVSLVLGTVTPKTAGPSGGKSKITLTGTVQNRAGRALPGLAVRLRTSATHMTSRTQLAQYAAGQPSWLRGLAAQRQLPGANAAGGTAPFSLSTTTAAVGFQAFGVYPIGVEVVNQYGQVLAGLNTFITFVPERRDFKRLSVGWVWPLIDRQHRTTDDTFIDDQLTTDMAPGGRLNGLVDAAAGTNTPITWSIDPALMDDVQTMAKGAYTVRAPRAKEGARKSKSTVAAQWLNSLKTAFKGDPYFTVPYADPDAVALVRHDMSNHLAIAYANANTNVAGEALGRQPTVQAAWPPSGMAGQGTLNELAEHGRLGDGAFLLSSAAFADPSQGYTPSATTRVPTEQGPKRTVVYDETLNKIVSSNTRSPGTAVLAEQRFLAETAMIAAEAPEVARSLVIAPDRRWNPSPAFAKSLLTYTSGAVWMQKTPLEQIANAAPQDRVYRGYPDALEGAELDARYLEPIADISRSAARFTSIMVEPVTMTYQRAVLRMESSYWRGKSRLKRAVAARQALADQVSKDISRVRIITSENNRVSLAGNSGRIPITIANDLPNQTIKVRLEVVPENTARLQVGRLEDEVIELGPEQKVTRPIPIRSAGNGNVQVQLRLKSADGRAFGRTTTITVRTTGYGRLALLITGGGLAVLFVGVGVRAMRARRRRNSEAAGDGSTGTGPASAGPPEPGAPFAGDPAGLGHAPGDGRPPSGDGRADGPGAGFHSAAFPPPTARYPDPGTGFAQPGTGFAQPAVVPGTAGTVEPPEFMGPAGPAGQSAPVHPTAGAAPGTDPWADTGPGLERPGLDQPELGQPGTDPGQPGTDQPGPGQPSAGQPGPGQSGAGPGQPESEAGQPGPSTGTAGDTGLPPSDTGRPPGPDPAAPGNRPRNTD